MRFMLLLKLSAGAETGRSSTGESRDAIENYNQALAQAGVLLDAAGLRGSAGARLRFDGSQRIVSDGPFPDTDEHIAGYWMIEVKSTAEAVEWARRCPLQQFADQAEIEVRQIIEPGGRSMRDAPAT